MPASISVLQTRKTPSTLYTIGEAADVLGIAIPTIRMYEREGLIIPLRKNSRHRRFSSTELERIRHIRRMINVEKVSIAGIRRLFSLIPCWKIKNCPPEVRTKCVALATHEMPCWMVTGKSWQCKSTECRLCPVYTDATDGSALKETIAHFTLSHLPQEQEMVHVGPI
jgi:MerR family transcriptional regulator/heat shock protein HspR